MFPHGLTDEEFRLYDWPNVKYLVKPCPLNLKTTKAPAEDQQLLPQQSWCHPLFIITSPAGVQKLPTLLCFALFWSKHQQVTRTNTTWSAWTTGPTATWPGRSSASWTAGAAAPGSTRASVAPLRLCPELSAPSTTHSPSTRAPWTACTNRTHLAHSQRNHPPLTKAWWRNKEAAAGLSKVGTQWAEFTAVFLLCHL